jgi:hypothetical protein
MLLSRFMTHGMKTVDYGNRQEKENCNYENNSTQQRVLEKLTVDHLAGQEIFTSFYET